MNLNSKNATMIRYLVRTKLLAHVHIFIHAMLAKLADDRRVRAQETTTSQ